MIHGHQVGELVGPRFGELGGFRLGKILAFWGRLRSSGSRSGELAGLAF